MKILFILTNVFFQIDVNVIQLTYKFDLKFKVRYFIINIDDV